LYTDPSAQENDVPQFEVTGGEGAYVVQARCGGTEVVLWNPEGGKEDVDVWVSDQGASFPGQWVSHSIDEVLAVTKYFFEHGELDPRALWE
jgi:hypothetical protein